MARRSLKRLALVAGVVASVTAWSRLEPAPTELAANEEPPAPEPLPTSLPVPAPETAPAAPAHRSFGRRLATSFIFATLFCAGAALTAAAGNEVASFTSAQPAADVTTDANGATVSTDTTTDTTETSTDTTDMTTDALETTAETTEPAPAAEPGDATTDGATESVDTSTSSDAGAVAAPDQTDTVTVEATPVAAPDPSDAVTVTVAAPVPVPVPAPTQPTVAAAKKHVSATSRKRHARRHVFQATSSPLVAAAPAPFPVLPFDLQSWLNDNPAAPAGAAAVAIAEHYLGVPYRWGGADPATGFDCSGLTKFVYAQLGIWLPHYAAAQFLAYPRLDPSQLAPGDLVFFEAKSDGPGHVAIYVGNDQIVEAPHTGAVVRIGSLSGSAASLGFLGAVRPYTDATTGVVPALPQPQQLFGLGAPATYRHVQLLRIPILD
jgi:cell wall-associated NlpC family hydrolase